MKMKSEIMIDDKGMSGSALDHDILKQVFKVQK